MSLNTGAWENIAYCFSIEIKNTMYYLLSMRDYFRERKRTNDMLKG